MKYRYYLTRITGANQEPDYKLSRGEELEHGLAIVRIDENQNLDFKGQWIVIDIASGLFVGYGRGKLGTRKQLLIMYNDCKGYVHKRVDEGRKLPRYKKACEELEIEKKNWRASGYEIV